MNHAQTDPLVDILLPVYNEEHVLERSVTTLRDFLGRYLTSFGWFITIGDNASTDRTLEVARRLEAAYPDVRAWHLERKGRGRMVKHAWQRSEAEILCYMDIDLSTDLAALPPLVQAIADGSDVAIGSRQYKGSQVDRSLRREIISQGYIVILKLLLRFPFSDAQCGFKAMSKKAVNELFPLIKDDEWFFDTELLFLAHKLGYRVTELPVRWIEDRDSRVKILRTMWLDMKGVWRMMRSRRLWKR
ncbi:MAG: glycosyltransferase [Candidatus Aminicenantes bacterium]|nr:glycosyltransferase [Candidatus Aminicenantes bacterium]